MPYKNKEDKIKSDKDRYERNKEKILKQAKEYRDTHKEERLKYNQEWVKKNNKQYRTKQLQYKYGITIEDYDALREEQDFCCAICAKHELEFKKSLCVDHDHKTGAVRQLLCQNCNTALGLLEEDKGIVYSLLAYIEKHNG